MNIAQPTSLTGEAAPSGETGAHDGDNPQSAAAPPAGLEELLERHGLISHIAALDADTGDADAAAFLRDVSRLARNTVRLSDRRIGLLFDGAPPSAMSSVPHHIKSISEAGAASPSFAAEAAAAPHEESLSESVSATGAPFGGTDAQPIASTDGAVPMAALEDALGPLLDAAVRKHVEPLIDAHEAIRGERRQWQSDVTQFWDGMEAVLRMLNETATRLSGAQAMPPPDAPQSPMTQEDAAELKSTLADLETTLAIGFEASGVVRDANQVALEGHLTALRETQPAPAPDLSGALAPLLQALHSLQSESRSELASLRSGLEALPNTAQALRSSIDTLVAGREAQETAHGALQRLEAQCTGMAAEVSTLSQVQRGATDRIEQSLTKLGDALDTSDGSAEALSRLESSLQDLVATITGRGGMLSDAVETSSRSMKNFWLASEDTLKRFEGAIERFAGEGADGQPGAADGILGRIDEIAGLMTAEEQGACRIRLALAEVLAHHLKAAHPHEEHP